jgi:hypothetical protein
MEFGTTMNSCRVKEYSRISEKSETPAAAKTSDEAVEQSEEASLC